MARDRQWVMLDQSQSKHREARARDIEEGRARDKNVQRADDTPPEPRSYGPGE